MHPSFETEWLSQSYHQYAPRRWAQQPRTVGPAFKYAGAFLQTQKDALLFYAHRMQQGFKVT